ncbi:MAG: hypothetical protein AB1437_12725 [Pseudomonadota bacterium]
MKLKQSILAALLAACALPGLAQVTSGASLGNLAYTLYDLDLSDANMPSLAFSVPDGAIPSYLGGGYTGISYAHRVYYNPVLLLHGSDSSDATSRTSTWDDRAATGTVTLGGRGGTGMGQQLQLAVEAREWSGVQAQINADSWSDGVYFTLAPGTGVTFTASLSSWSGISLDEEYYGMAQVLGSLTVRDLADLNNSDVSDSRAYFAGTEPGKPPPFDRTTLLSVSFENRGANPMYAYAEMDLDGMAYTIPVSMVPEPGQLSMLLAGVLLLPLVRRRVRA